VWLGSKTSDYFGCTDVCGGISLVAVIKPLNYLLSRIGVALVYHVNTVNQYLNRLIPTSRLSFHRRACGAFTLRAGCRLDGVPAVVESLIARFTFATVDGCPCRLAAATAALVDAGALGERTSAEARSKRDSRESSSSSSVFARARKVAEG